MSSLSIFVFDNADNFVIRRDLTSSELAAKSATFSLPKSLASTPCSFYAIANYDASSAKTRAALTALVEKSAADYNGTFAEVSAAAKRSGGFLMSGSATKPVTAGASTAVAITLKRDVAKIAVQSPPSDAFASRALRPHASFGSLRSPTDGASDLVVNEMGPAPAGAVPPTYTRQTYIGML